MRAFPRDVGIHAFSGCLSEIVTSASANDSDAAAQGRPARDEVNGTLDNPAHLLDQLISRDPPARLPSDLLPSAFEERGPAPPTQRLAELCVVAEATMGIQGKMCAVDRYIMLQELPQEAKVASYPGVAGSPEQAMVNDEQIGSPGDGLADGGFAGVHSCGELVNRVFLGDLQAVVGVFPILKTSRLEEPVTFVDEVAQEYRAGCIGDPLAG